MGYSFRHKHFDRMEKFPILSILLIYYKRLLTYTRPYTHTHKYTQPFCNTSSTLSLSKDETGVETLNIDTLENVP